MQLRHNPNGMLYIYVSYALTHIQTIAMSLYTSHFMFPNLRMNEMKLKP